MGTKTSFTGIGAMTSESDRSAGIHLRQGWIKAAVQKLETFFLRIIQNTIAEYEGCAFPRLLHFHYWTVAYPLRRVYHTAEAFHGTNTEMVQQEMSMRRIDSRIHVGLPLRL